ncbi:MAG: tetratricopeptide repeat protein, partial [Polyangiaceae bacterium]
MPTAAGARRAICPYCQCELHLDVGGGGPEVTNLITLAQSAYASGNFEESLNYANKALELDAHNPMVWLGKALATANLSTLQHQRFTEMEDLLRRGLQFATDDQSAWAVRQQAAAAISVFGPSFFEAARRAYVAFQGPGSLAVFVEQCVEVVQMLRL